MDTTLLSLTLWFPLWSQAEQCMPQAFMQGTGMQSSEPWPPSLPQVSLFLFQALRVGSESPLLLKGLH